MRMPSSGDAGKQVRAARPDLPVPAHGETSPPLSDEPPNAERSRNDSGRSSRGRTACASATWSRYPWRAVIDWAAPRRLCQPGPVRLSYGRDLGQDGRA